MDWKTPSDDSPESTTAPNRRCTVSSCARSSPAPLPTWPGNDSDSRLKKAGTNIYRKSGDCPKTPKKTHTHKWYIYIIYILIYYNIIYNILYILYILYIISISFVVFFQASIEACSETYCATLHLPCLFAWTAQRHQPHHGLAVGRPSWSRVQWLFSDSATPLVSEGVQLKLFHFLILFQLIQPWWGSPVHRFGVKKNTFGPSISAAG